MDLTDVLFHHGESREEYYGAVSPPIFQSSNFCFRNVGEMREKLKRELEIPFYTRGHNPTVSILREKLAALEGAEDALVFASGSAAVAAAVMSIVKQGDHAVCVQKPYSWTLNLFSKYLSRFGVDVTFVDGSDARNFENAIQGNTKLIYMESPNSLTFELQDIEAVTRVAKAKNITTIIDNSYNSPINQSPVAMGVDLVLHSATKYLNGHSDVVAGVVCGSSVRIKKMMSEEFMTLGGIISPHDAWLMLRGLRTLELRVNRSSESAQTLAHFLEDHPKVKKLYYPFSEKNPQLALAKKQMKQGGGLLSMELNVDSVEKVERFCDALKYFLLATSWGGYESLAFPMCAIGGSNSFENKPMPWNLVRLYIGLEDAGVLQKDLEQALSKI
ncbi:MAG TPA: aminotransferase class I/II-fold pyridoxal phosphate-dependent enzyme [Bacteroidia bacterium]|jgi:cystathionine beta-lyase/cystathionine gamma-synthase